jgi:hypothetical protein
LLRLLRIEIEWKVVPLDLLFLGFCLLSFYLKEETQIVWYSIIEYKQPLSIFRLF